MSAENIKKRKVNIDTDVNDNKKACKDDGQPEPRSVTPDEAGTDRDRDQDKDRKAKAYATPRNSTKLTIEDFYRAHGRTPPKGSKAPMDDRLTSQAEELLGIKFDNLDVEQQLRFVFIMLKDYPKYLNENLFASNSPFRALLQSDGLSTPKEALVASLQTDTPCGIRLGRLIQLGGDVITELCNRDQLDPCIQTFGEFLEQNPVWSDTETSIFKEEYPGGCRVEPFIRLQIEQSDLCYLIQNSNCLHYHLQMKALRGAENIESVKLNNARHIRNVYTSEQSCKHVYVGRGANSEESMLVVLRQGNPGVSVESDLLEHVKIKDFDGPRAAEELYDNLCRRLKRSGAGLFDVKNFKEFEAKGATKHAGNFSTKTSRQGKHTLLLVDVRKSTEDDDFNGGGYYALFQNTWKTRPIWVEMGFDILLSMDGMKFMFINNELSFDGEFDATDVREQVLAMSSSPPPVGVCRYANDEPAQNSEEDGLDAENAVIGVGAGGVEGRTRAPRRFTFSDSFEPFTPKRNAIYEG